MVSRIISLSHSGLQVYPVEIEVDIHRGLPSMAVVGLVDTQVKESRDRVRASLKNSGYEFPSQRITVNLAPAHLKKEGTQYDLAIALGIIRSSRQSILSCEGFMVLGELSLEGKVRPVRGVFPMALTAKKLGAKLIVPEGNAQEAAFIEGVEVFGVSTLSEAVTLLSEGSMRLPIPHKPFAFYGCRAQYDVDFSEVKGQAVAKRAIEVAMCGMHNLIMIGPPGVGKTMLARRIPTILPQMEQEEVLETTKIYSVAGFLHKDKPLMKERPFRAPHHTSSSIALVGGGTAVRPGEVTLAHNGVLFLDELPEFSRDALEALRQPLEDGSINISRAAKTVQYPSRFLLVSSMNPCPCGFFGSRDRPCHCSSYQIRKYRNKVSGPLLDRIDIHIELRNINTEILMARAEPVESSEQIQKRVEEARSRQRERLKKEKIFFNSQMGHKHIARYCILDSEAKEFLKRAIKEFAFSARSYDKILKVGRTIADMAGHERIMVEDISEAIQYRSLDKGLWV